MKVRGYQSAGMLQNNWYASVVEPFRGCNTSYKYEAIRVSSRLYLVFDYGSFVLVYILGFLQTLMNMNLI